LSRGALFDTDFVEVFVTIARSSGADDETFASCFDDFLSDTPEAIDLKDSPDLGKETVDQAEITAGDPDNGGNRFTIWPMSSRGTETKSIFSVVRTLGTVFGFCF
jgi:hypothetical protein